MFIFRSTITLAQTTWNKPSTSRSAATITALANCATLGSQTSGWEMYMTSARLILLRGPRQVDGDASQYKRDYRWNVVYF